MMNVTEPSLYPYLNEHEYDLHELETMAHKLLEKHLSGTMEDWDRANFVITLNNFLQAFKPEYSENEALVETAVFHILNVENSTSCPDFDFIRVLNSAINEVNSIYQ